MSLPVRKHGERITQEVRDKVTYRYHAITKRINQSFWNSNSDTAHSFYVGSYGRGTAITTSDVDILVELPQREYQRFSIYKSNGQSKLLQIVKEAIILGYPKSSVYADGQVVVVDFSDGIKFEIVPCFLQTDWYGNKTYIYPDTNLGGNWKSTNPKAEQITLAEKDKSSNGLLKDTCRHIRYIRDTYFSSYHLSGILIDSFVYSAIRGWHFLYQNEEASEEGTTYEEALFSYYNEISCNGYMYPSIYAPGSNMRIDTSKGWDVLGKILKFMMN